MEKNLSNQPERRHHHVADSNCRDFHYTQEEIDHIHEKTEEHNGHFNEFPLLPNNVDEIAPPEQRPLRHFMDKDYDGPYF